MIWTSEFEAKDFSDIIGKGDKIKQICDNGLNHLLLYGKPGLGKSMSVKVIVNQLGMDYIKLNASDERGIDTIRGKLTSFAMTKSSNGKKKIIWLDEMEAMTNETLDALRGFMDTYQEHNIIIGTTNYLYKIPDPIQSRFTKINFNDIGDEDIFHRLKGIVETKGVAISDDLLLKLIQICKLDVRSCINKLQELNSLGRTITENDLKPQTELEEKIYSLLQQRNFPDARQELLDSNVKMEDFLNSFHEYIVNLSIVEKKIAPDKTKEMIKAFFEAISVLKFSANENIVVEYLLLRIMELM